MVWSCAMVEGREPVKVVYIAGPFRAETAWGIECNIRRAEELGWWVAFLGAMPLIPHANTRFFHGSMPDEFWLKGTLELMRRCDAVALVDGWEASSGARVEVEEARRLGIPVFTSIHHLEDWLKGNDV